KVRNLRKRFSGLISVDGGINLETGRQAAQEGADVFVAGSAIFREQNRKEYISELRRAIL
ncbi:MAG: ribulose-phosphate 3-epimerase, partial [Candidatus Omnitrophica bacterium]|nr:ribulose-phosphate 3-epimerase [Candidatus Omnitrophota bacterium]